MLWRNHVRQLWLPRSVQQSTLTLDEVLVHLQKLYQMKLQPLEEMCLFNASFSAQIDVQHFLAKPSVIVVGQYSTGKTSFLQYILGKNFPGMRIGPEPTTDKFTVLMRGQNDVIIPGNVLVSVRVKHFQPLERFGQNFLNKLQCSQTDAKLLESITLIDTPGILSGEKQRIQRGYDFESVLEWFSYSVDMILLIFDSNKLDISDELRRTIECLKGNEDKVRVILNKADTLDANSLFRVYGALMWSLGKILQAPEVIRVYIGSFWNKPKVCPDYYRRIFEIEENDLLTDIKNLPRTSLLRKLNDVDKRAKQVLIHAYIMGKLHTLTPIFNKEKAKGEIIERLETVYQELKEERNIQECDFPDLDKFKEYLEKIDFRKIKKLDLGMINAVKSMRTDDLPKLISLLPNDVISVENDSGSSKNISC